ncbi:hypothetical protein C7960_0725 [Methanohalophilus euhalobius]|jgi:uncharacterized FlgJ-related protein|uniref:Uncharacterized protein n=1 Tax=Methanohalophilus euhalobius TaxID=51203 RepID=A0A285GFL1_9EURY|nr:MULTISPECIES: hypothetical protein [Methanohalophilus]ODV48880.1 MAG: hypothetical protein A8273_1801 [Methanohalophilus sp. 2-GBenrich]RXG33380.1 hypothetical protein CI957_1972 [Methanohalophilus sp. WG1-DM]TCL11563.1 hypothetical protein C7960_0725 [Methanohalophilus euhalobius]SNY22370.1 hypothetical protein SAMN06295989_1162 [Methanohalophilus euhalobius]
MSTHVSQTTTIPTTKAIRDRLKNYGHKGETYSDILTRMMDREEFMDRMYKRLEERISLSH